MCKECINTVELALIRGNKGLCQECLELVILGQGDVAYNSDGVCVIMLLLSFVKNVCYDSDGI